MPETKIISSMEKCFSDQTPDDFSSISQLYCCRNGIASFQLAVYGTASDSRKNFFLKLSAESTLLPFIKIRTVENVPNFIPLPDGITEEEAMKDGHIRVTPGLYPDVLLPLTHNGSVPVISRQLHCVRFDIEPEGLMPAGEHSVKIKLTDSDGKTAAEHNIRVTVIDAVLPEQDTKVTQWFHADCLADYYSAEVFSDRHFEICRNFIRCAVKNGINMIMVPVFTPPLDTAVGGERTTVQLVKIKLQDGNYLFDFSLVSRWLDMCLECGIKYFEISHLFTQWGAYHAPKITAEVNGEKKQIFGWDTDAGSDEYISFLNQFLREFTAFLSGKGFKDNVYFHISDEPDINSIGRYRQNKAAVREVLKGWKQFDALSETEYYRQGLCDIPVPSVGSIDAFLKEDIPERWIYYCLFPVLKYSNRLMTMHSARTRFFGIQMYRYGITGFLHWGYNFYNNQFSEDCINPFLNTNGGYWNVGGDCFSVYPGRNGVPLESVRIKAFTQGLYDIRLLKLCEKYYSRDFVISKVEEICGPVVFDRCVNDSETMQKIEDCLYGLINSAVSK